MLKREISMSAQREKKISISESELHSTLWSFLEEKCNMESGEELARQMTDILIRYLKGEIRIVSKD